MSLFDWDYALESLPLLAGGLKVTVQATVLGMAFALMVGLVLALARRSRFTLISWPTAFIIEFIRSTPLLVQIYFLFYVLPTLGLTMSPLATGILGLGLHYAAYCSEVYRAGIESIPRGQWEAATALNLSRLTTTLKVILPQAIPPVVPALGNYLVAMFKDTPLLSAITVLEMLQQAKILGAESFRYTEPLTLVGVAFLVMSLIAAAGIRTLETKLKPYAAT
ncbi:MAG: ectoine/hydroxyectoine ABC transporter permease subunit EhuD [Betaproteobacteria bacterium]|jgi:polar amino acid transport system permease protein|nr:MAG: ectoine/hydroxyectoine ABC transporter permease subunit EhuD [Betaproteobacteria bacterium]